MDKNKAKTFAKKVIISGLLLSLSGCYAPGIRMTGCYQENAIPQKSQKTNVLTLKKDKAKNTLIVLSPHFDDAVLSVGGIISEFNGPKYIVTFFTTPTATAEYLTRWDELSGFEKSTDARKIRENENVNAANMLGARVINKGYVDNQYEKRSASDNESIRKRITKDIEQIVGSTNNANVTVIGPSYFGDKITHADHLLVSNAFVQAIKNKCYANADFYFYEDLPYTYLRFKDEEITLDRILTDYYGGLRLDKNEIFISEQSFDSKRKEIEAYPSQVKAFHRLGKEIIEDITNFGMSRCPQVPLSPKPCEVIYEIR